MKLLHFVILLLTFQMFLLEIITIFELLVLINLYSISFRDEKYKKKGGKMK